MKKQLLIIFLALSTSVVAQTLHNGITLSDKWPPHYEVPKQRQDMPVPYLENKPSVIPINTGRQLFIDDFIISATDMKRACHKPEMYTSNPVFRPDKEWEKTTEGCPYADPFSDGVWYDELAGKFKLWYRTGAGYLHKQDNQTFYTGYAESEDGIHWTKPVLDVLEGTNIVDTYNRDAATIWLDKREKDPAKRYKMFNIERDPRDKRWYCILKYSADGIHWNHIARSGRLYDRTTAFYNPFTDKWALSLKQSTSLAYRSRYYIEASDPDIAVSYAHRVSRDIDDGSIHFWFAPSDKEKRNPKYPEVAPQIYNFDVMPYESIMLGLYSVWQGPENDVCDSLGIQKRNEIALGYSRDGFHFHRPTHDMFIGVNETDGAWNWGNVQSVIGTPIIVGDSLYIYCGGRAINKIMWDGDTSTGLAKLRRDGFVSMGTSGGGEKTLLTEPVTFDGKYFFVNADIETKGKLQIELLDSDNNIIPGFSRKECQIVKTNSTKQIVKWKKNQTVESLQNKVVRVKFYVTDGDLYAFWVSPWISGESRGYTGGGGPGLSPTGIDIPMK